MSATRLEFASVRSLDDQLKWNPDGSFHPRSFYNRQFECELAPGAGIAAVSDWIDSGGHIEYALRATGEPAGVAVTSARVWGRRSDGSYVVRFDTALHRPWKFDGGWAASLFVPTAGLVRPRLETAVVCFGDRPHVHTPPDVREWIRGSSRLVVVAEIDVVFRRQVRSIGIFDGWLWRHVDPFPHQLGGRLMANRFWDPREAVDFGPQAETVSFEQAVVAGMSPHPAGILRVDSASFDRAWNWLSAEAALPDHVAGRPRYR